MEHARVFINMIHIFGCFLCITLTLAFYVAALDDVKQDDVKQHQIYMNSELPNNHILRNKSLYKVLTQTEKCSYKDLKRCHSSEDNHWDYYARCYSDECSSEKYFCLNVPDENAIHLCGEPNPWNKRSRDIAVFNSTVPGHVDVYRTDCPVGYFQENRNIAFTPCVKDESLVFVGKNPNNSLVLWRCNTLKYYCNANGATFFELGSDEDSCVYADKYNPKMKCNPADELALNCSCIQKCQASEERVWDGTNYCRLISESTSISKEHVTKATKPTTISSRRANRTTIQPDRNSARQEEDLSGRIFERKNTESYENSHTAVINGLVVIVLIVIILVIAVVIFGLCYIRRHHHKNGRCQLFHRNFNTIKKTHIRNDECNYVYAKTAIVNFQKDVQGNIQPDLQHALVTVQDEATSETNSIHRNGSSSEPLIQYMKDNDELEPDSGICSESQTYVKAFA